MLYFRKAALEFASAEQVANMCDLDVWKLLIANS